MQGAGIIDAWARLPRTDEAIPLAWKPIPSSRWSGALTTSALGTFLTPHARSSSGPTPSGSSGWDDPRE